MRKLVFLLVLVTLLTGSVAQAASNFAPVGYGPAAVPEPASVCLLLARVRF